jgi:hypothetical protein
MNCVSRWHMLFEWIEGNYISTSISNYLNSDFNLILKVRLNYRSVKILLHYSDHSYPPNPLPVFG